MAELWRITPNGSETPAGSIWTTREALDRAIASWLIMADDRSEKPSYRRSAQMLATGTIQVAANVVWVDVDD